MYSHSRRGVKEGEDSEMPEDGIDSMQINGKNNRENSLKDNENIVIDKELEKIRKRRLNSDKTFLVNTIRPRTSDDYTLVFGVLAGLIFFGSVFIASSGVIAAESIFVDDTLSGTVFDSEDCLDKRNVMYFEIYSIDENIRVKTQNIDSKKSTIMMVNLDNNENNTTNYFGGLGNQEITLQSEDIDDANYIVYLEVYIWDEIVNLSHLS